MKNLSYVVILVSLLANCQSSASTCDLVYGLRTFFKETINLEFGNARSAQIHGSSNIKSQYNYNFVSKQEFDLKCFNQYIINESFNIDTSFILLHFAPNFNNKDDLIVDYV